MKKLTILSATAVLILSTFALTSTSGCAGPTRASAGTDGEWLQPDERMASQLRLKAKTVEVLRERDRVEYDQLVTWFATQGEVAYGTVLDMATSSDAKMANFGLATLNSIGDPRLLAPLEKRMPFDEVTDLATRLSYARAGMAMGKFAYAPVMLEGMSIEGMEPGPTANRGLAYQALRRATRKDLPFTPGAGPEVRARQIADWRTWIDGWNSDPMRQPGQKAAQ